MTVTEAKEIKRLVEVIETTGEMRELLSKPNSSLTLNIQNNYDYMGAYCTEIPVDSFLQELLFETIEKYEQDLLDELSRYSIT